MGLPQDLGCWVASTLERRGKSGIRPFPGRASTEGAGLTPHLAVVPPAAGTAASLGVRRQSRADADVYRWLGGISVGRNQPTGLLVRIRGRNQNGPSVHPQKSAIF